MTKSVCTEDDEKDEKKNVAIKFPRIVLEKEATIPAIRKSFKTMDFFEKSDDFFCDT